MHSVNSSLDRMARRARIALVALGAAALAATAAWAQGSGSIEGRVADDQGRALGNVTVVAREAGVATITGNDGKYRLSDLAPGTYTLDFTLGEFQAEESGIEVGAGARVTRDATVDWDVSFAETITVFSASRKQERVVDAPAAVTVIPQDLIQREMTPGQAPKLLETAPGVDFTQSGLYDFNFNARGFNSSLNRRILTLIDGRDPSVPFLGAMEWAALSFPVDEYASIELVRGPGSALYGANAFNGVLNMTTKQPRYAEGGKFTLTGGDLATRRGDLRLGGQLGDSQWYYKVTGGVQNSEDFARSRNLAAEYSSFCASAAQTGCLRREARGLALDEVDIWYGGLRLDHYFSGGKVGTFEAGLAEIEGPVFLTGIGRVQVTDTSRPWARFNFNTEHWNFHTFYDARDAKNQVALASGAFLFEDSSNTHVELQGNWGFAADQGRIVLGGSFHKQDVDTSNAAGVHTLMTEAKKEEQTAAFGQLEYAFGENVKAVVAARWDDSTLFDSRFSPKASLVWSLNPNHTLRFTYNEAFQVPNYSEFFLAAPAGAPITAFTPLDNAVRGAIGRSIGLNNIPLLARGNADLEVEEITAFEVGYSGILSNKVFLTIDYYQNKVENFVTDLLPGVNPAFAAYAPPVPEPLRTLVLNTLRGGLGGNFAGLTTLPNGQPALVLSYANAGKVDTEGVEMAINWYITDNWVFDANYTWFDFDVKEQLLGDRLLPNAPETKYNVGLAYRAARWDVSVKYRWVDDFDWAAGVFVGPVESYDVVNMAANFKLNDHVAFGVNVSNVTDNEHWESWGGDLLGRRALGTVSFSW